MKISSRTTGKKLMALILCAVMVITMLPPNTKVSQAAETVANPRTENGVSTWDCIYFGNYYQSNSSTKEPIKWRVLSVEGNEAFVVADMALDCQPYNEIDVEVTWETCTLRKWLNSTFLEVAFDAEEQSAIKTTTVINEDNIDYGTEGGNTTSDKIFLLSQNEVKNPKYGFNSDYEVDSETRQCKASAYAVENNCWISSSDGCAGNCCWWLRSPGYDSCGAGHACYVDCDGRGTYGSKSVRINDNSVRPALNLNLSASLWEYAGTVSANVGEGSGENSTVTETTATPIIKPTPTTKPDPTLQQTPNTNVQPSQLPSATLTPAADNQNPAADSTKTTLKKVTAFKAKALKKALKLTWKKAAGASGYEIQYSLNKNFKKAKKITSKKASVKTRTIKGLKKNKKYYIRIRATMRKGKRKINGPWVKISKKTKA